MGARQFRSLVGDLVRRLVRGRHGNVSPIMALMLVPIIGSFGMAAEASRWFVAQRGAQNAVDAAVIAAAQNGCATGGACAAVGPTYDFEAKSVTKQFGFTHNGADIDVAASNVWPCPGGGNTCYSVLMTLKSPIYLLRIAGFNGDATAASGQPAQTIQALAVAQRQPGLSYCITAFGDEDNAIRFEGAPTLDLTGCDLFTPNGGASCNAHSGDTIRYANVSTAGDAKNCGAEQVTDKESTDAYADLATNIPDADTSCGSVYTQADRNGPNKNVVTTVANQLSGSMTFSSASPKCGDVKLLANTTVTGDSVLVIHNGRLDLGGFTLTVASGAHLTIIFGGTVASGADHFVMSSVAGAVIDYSAPTSGTWAGVAYYQDPNLTNGIDMDVSGNDPEFNITGLIYASKAEVEISGAINHATAGDACLAFVVDTLRISGTASIFATPTRECDRAGLDDLERIDKIVLVQ